MTSGPDSSPPSPPGVAVTIEGLAHRFGELETLRGLDLAAAAGETVAVVGPSGCGKSTLLEIVGGLNEQTAGIVSVGGATDPDGRLSRCAWMPQRDGLLPWRTALDNAALGLRMAGVRRGEARSRAHALLERLGLAGFAATYPGRLSGGMRQRVAFARTLLSGRPVLLLDEPLAALDAITRADLQEWLRETMREEHRTTVLVTHDVEEAIYLADRVLVLSPRPARVVWSAPTPAPGAGDRADEVAAAEFGALRAEAEHRLRAAMGEREGRR